MFLRIGRLRSKLNLPDTPWYVTAKLIGLPRTGKFFRPPSRIVSTDHIGSGRALDKATR